DLCAAHATRTEQKHVRGRIGRLRIHFMIFSAPSAPKECMCDTSSNWLKSPPKQHVLAGSILGWPIWPWSTVAAQLHSACIARVSASANVLRVSPLQGSATRAHGSDRVRALRL